MTYAADNLVEMRGWNLAGIDEGIEAIDDELRAGETEDAGEGVRHK